MDLDTRVPETLPLSMQSPTGVWDAVAPESETGTSPRKATGRGKRQERREGGWVPGDTAEKLDRPRESPPPILYEVRANAFVF